MEWNLRRTLLLLLLAGWVGMVHAQKEDYVWFFGDSLLLDFNTEPPEVLPIAGLGTWATGTSISDEYGNLLFYMNHDSIRSLNGELVGNGFGFGGSRTYSQGSWLLPTPDVPKRIYVFAIGVDCGGAKPCFSYSVLEYDSIPKLITKNIKIANQICSKVAVTQHSNGRDWWILTHESETDVFFSWLLTPQGLRDRKEQVIGANIGSIDNSNFGEMTFSPQGDKLALVGLSGLVEIYDFDRCTGELSNANRLATGGGGYSRYYYGCEFSPNGKLLYITQATPFSTIGFWGRILQLDLTADPIWWSRDTVWTASDPLDEPIQLQLGPNGKIYCSHVAFPYTQPHFVNQNLTVIHSPDSLGTACNVDPHSISLLPFKGSAALPNYPNFRLGPITLQPANAGADQHTCPGVPVPIGTEDTTGTLTYSWWPQDGLDDPFSPTTNASPIQTTTYYLTVSDPSISASCNYTEDSVTVIVDWCHHPDSESLNPDLTKPIIPTIVTPDGDGQDDLFSIRWLPNGTKVVIFDNHGRLVFESMDYQNDWPGSKAAGGMYFYRVQFPGEELRVGKVMVLP